jgi:hypothetical protein
MNGHAPLAFCIVPKRFQRRREPVRQSRFRDAATAQCKKGGEATPHTVPRYAGAKA